MQDNELDKLINDAANQHHPPYDDEAWGKMRILLDKHLPQKKDRRKPFIFWLLFLVLGGAVTLGILQPWNNTPAGSTQSNTTIAASSSTATTTAPQPPAAGAAGSAATNTTASSPAASTANTTGAAPANVANGTGFTPAANTTVTSSADAVPNSKTVFTSKSRSAIRIKKPGAVSEAEEPTAAAPPVVKQKRSKQNENDRSTAAPVQETTTVNTESPLTEKNNNTAPVTTGTEQQKQAIPVQKDTAITTPNPAAATTKNKSKKGNGFANNFAITVSAGADMSFIELSNPGKVKGIYGAGFAYSIGKRLKISTGLFVSKKVYDADPYQYKFPNGVTYPYLTGINADCNIYEIPVNVYYNFKQHNNHNWFAGAGLSSLLMKKEHYDYQYKTPAGQWYNYERTITNENKHYFSVATLSGGYQYTLSRRIALTAEPYVKIPLGGVGAGKIKLNSSGILVSAAVKPFARTKK